MKITLDRLQAAGVPDQLVAPLAAQIGRDPAVARGARRVTDTHAVAVSLSETIGDIEDSGMVQGTSWRRKMLAHYRPMRLRARRAHKAALRRLSDRLTVAV